MPWSVYRGKIPFTIQTIEQGLKTGTMRKLAGEKSLAKGLQSRNPIASYWGESRRPAPASKASRFAGSRRRLHGLRARTLSSPAYDRPNGPPFLRRAAPPNVLDRRGMLCALPTA